MVLTFPLLLLIVVVVITNVKIVPQSQAFVIERLGAYLTTWEVGLNITIPFRKPHCNHSEKYHRRFGARLNSNI